jgi:uncharacterized protein YukE
MSFEEDQTDLVAEFENVMKHLTNSCLGTNEALHEVRQRFNAHNKEFEDARQIDDEDGMIEALDAMQDLIDETNSNYIS